jgi:DNA (cytosine-5)-methyltransferase 1
MSKKVNKSKTKPKKIKYIDLCSGIGGFRIALNNLSVPRVVFKCILSADIKQDAIDTYNLNFNENNKITDIYTLKNEEIEPFDLLCAGFPCQPFSSAGQKKGFKDERGGMIFKIIDICKHHKPKNIILENVYNLMTLKNGAYIKRIKELFEGIGYIVNYGKLNSRDFGCPQSRERVYIVCSLEKEISFDNIKTKPKATLNNILEHSVKKTDIKTTFSEKLLQIHKEHSIYGCKIGDKRGGNKNIHSWDIGYNGVISEKERELMKKIMLQRRKKHWAKKKKIVWMDGMPLTYTEIKTFYDDDNLLDMLDNLVSKNYLRLEKPKDLINGKRVYKEDSEAGYNICKGKLSFPISKILDPSDVAPTLTATDSNRLAVIINGEIIRKLTPNELKKICGFPDTFVVPEHVNYYNLFGNMATPPVIEAILRLVYN